LSFGGGLAATFVLAFAVARFVFPNRLGALGLHGLAAVFSNTGYVGIPLLTTAYGTAGQLPAIVATVITGAVVMPIGIVIIELDFGRGHGPLTILRKVVTGVARSPLVLAAAAGLALSGFGIALPKPAATFCDIMGAAAGPCALFSIGLFLVGRAERAGAGEVTWLVTLKLLVQPAITWWIAFEVLDMDRLWANAAVLLAALPTGVLVFVLAQQYGLYLRRATMAILVSTLMAVFTLSVLVTFLGVG